MAPPCSGEQLSPRPSSDAATEVQARQACYEFSRGDEDLEIMFELNSDMGITLRHPESDAVARPPPPSGAGRRGLKRRVEEAPEGGLMDSSTGVPSGGYDWALAGLDMGQAPIFWQGGGDGRFASVYGDVSGGDAVQTLGLLGARLHKDARRQLELTKSCV
ncbi:unnamed protein product [Clonostachys chloroleuca]|uniref:Uncharacterized protein n=1 Tax=Clonostachys chloroleuca TaxID=1926264 RepID=A0AA35Q0P1_9HYPO|nr:unnamed protein product [Clonostachys chloroleuca]